MQRVWFYRKTCCFRGKNCLISKMGKVGLTLCGVSGCGLIWSLVWKRKHWLIGAFGLHCGALRSLSISIDLRFHPILLRTPSGSFYHSIFSIFNFREMSIATEDNPQDYCIVQPQSPEDIKVRSHEFFRKLQRKKYFKILREELRFWRKYAWVKVNNGFETYLTFKHL